MNIEFQKCRCGNDYFRPAISRKDGERICTACGISEALESIGIVGHAQERILKLVLEYEKYENK